jgi:hypothetical protein
MIMALFPAPFVAGIILLAFGWWHHNRLLRGVGDGFMAIACSLMVYQFYMIREYPGGISTGLFLSGWTDYLGFIVISLAGGLLAGDGLVQLLLKKSSSS